MEIFGWVVVTIGSLGVSGAVVMEIVKKEPIYMHLMKVMCLIFGAGGIILAMYGGS